MIIFLSEGDIRRHEPVYHRAHLNEHASLGNVLLVSTVDIRHTFLLDVHLAVISYLCLCGRRRKGEGGDGCGEKKRCGTKGIKN